MSGAMHELPPNGYTQVDFDQMPKDFPQPGVENNAYEPYIVGIEGQEFGQDPVALLEARPSFASRVGDRMSQVGSVISEAAQGAIETVQDPRFQLLARKAGEGALIGIGLANKEGGELRIDTVGVATTIRKLVKNPTPLGVAKVVARGAYGGYKEVNKARQALDEAYNNPT